MTDVAAHTIELRLNNVPWAADVALIHPPLQLWSCSTALLCSVVARDTAAAQRVYCRARELIRALFGVEHNTRIHRADICLWERKPPHGSDEVRTRVARSPEFAESLFGTWNNILETMASEAVAALMGAEIDHARGCLLLAAREQEHLYIADQLLRNALRRRCGVGLHTAAGWLYP